MQQIAVGGVDLDGVDAKPAGTFGGGGKGLLDALQSGHVERHRRDVTVGIGQARGRICLPALLGVGRDLFAAIPRQLRRRLAAGMSQLHGDRHGGIFADGRQDGFQCGFGGVVPQAEIAIGDATGGFHGGRFDDQQPRARQGQAAQMLHMPVAGPAIVGRILAHGRDDDAVLQGQGTEMDRGKQGAHGTSGHDRANLVAFARLYQCGGVKSQSGARALSPPALDAGAQIRTYGPHSSRPAEGKARRRWGNRQRLWNGANSYGAHFPER